MLPCYAPPAPFKPLYAACCHPGYTCGATPLIRCTACPRAPRCTRCLTRSRPAQHQEQWRGPSTRSQVGELGSRVCVHAWHSSLPQPKFSKGPHMQWQRISSNATCVCLPARMFCSHSTTSHLLAVLTHSFVPPNPCGCPAVACPCVLPLPALPHAGAVPHDKPDTSRVTPDQPNRFAGDKGINTGFGTGSAAPWGGDAVKRATQHFVHSSSSGAAGAW